MRIFNRPETIIRCTFIREGEQTEYLNFIDCDVVKVVGEIDKVFLSSFLARQKTEKKLQINVRPQSNGINGTQKTISTYKNITIKQLTEVLKSKF